MDTTIEYGKTAYIRYKGGVKNEEPLDDRSTGEPLAVVVGTLQIPQGIEDEIRTMSVGEHRRVEIPAESGYGAYQERLASWYPKSIIEDGYSLEVGDVVFWKNPDDGAKRPAWITSETDDTVKLDFNHPFAGKVLEYSIELVDVR